MCKGESKTSRQKNLLSCEDETCLHWKILEALRVFVKGSVVMISEVLFPDLLSSEELSDHLSQDTPLLCIVWCGCHNKGSRMCAD